MTISRYLKPSRLGSGDAHAGSVLCGDRMWRTIQEMGADGFINTKAPMDGYTIKNIYVNSSGKLVIHFDIEESSSAVGIKSTPPYGCYPVTNIYVNNEGKIVIQYDDTPRT